MSTEQTKVTVGNLIGETINLYLNNIKELVIPYLIILFPLNLLSALLNQMFMTAGGSDFHPITTSFSFLTWVVSLGILFFITLKSLEIYDDKINSGESKIPLVMKRLFPLVLLSILMVLGVVGGMILLIVPGIIFALRWTIADVVLINEQKDIRSSMKRSKTLTKGYKGTIFLTFLILILLYIIVYVFYFVIVRFSISGIYSLTAVTEFQASNPLHPTNIIYSLVGIILAPISPIFCVVLYKNILKEKEGNEVEELGNTFMSSQMPKAGE